MPSKRTGETVKAVKGKKERLIVSFESGKEIEMSPDTYSGFFLYKGKELTPNEFRKLKETAEEERMRALAINYAASGTRSKKETARKLIGKGSDSKKAYRLAHEMEEEGLIDDGALSEELFDRYSASGHGKGYIQEKLRQKGLEIPEKETDKEAMEKAFGLLEKQYSRLPLLKRKAKLSEAMYRRGYSREEYSRLVEQVENTKEQDKAEAEALRDDLSKMTAALPKDYNPKAEKPRVYSKLVNKGYRPEMIIRAMEDFI